MRRRVQCELTASMLAVRIYNEADQLSFDDICRIIKSMLDQIRKALRQGETLEFEGVGIVRLKMRECYYNAHSLDKTQPSVWIREKVLRVALGTDPLLLKRIKQNGGAGDYFSILFSEEECEEIRRQVASGEATIKGLVRELGVDRGVIRRILRRQSDVTPRYSRWIRNKINNEKGIE